MPNPRIPDAGPNRTPRGRNPFAPDPTDHTLNDGQVLYQMAFGARPEDFHPNHQPLAQGYSLLFQKRPALGPGLLGSADDVRRQIGAAQSPVDPAAAGGGAGSGNASAALPRRTLPTSYPKTLDSTVERHVAEYNQAHGLNPGDREYLDPDLIKAMIRQETGHNADALTHDPLQVNAHTGDWDPQKANYGLAKGVAPGYDLGVKAGIQWLRRKAYEHDDQGKEVRFRGWPNAVQRYNAHLPDYSDQVMDHLGEIKGGF